MPTEGEKRIIEVRKKIDESSGLEKDELEEELKSLESEMSRGRESLLKEFSSLTTGFVGADLAALAREAALRALRRYLPDIDLEIEEISQEILESMEIRVEDFHNALKDINPSAMREVFLEVSHVHWNDVGGLQKEKEEVREAVEYPLTKPGHFEELGIEPPRGVLLYGPPGTGKTLIAKAVANESGANFIPVRGPQLLSKWVGESERAVREIFRKARQVSPSIIFFDELDSLTPVRGRGSDSHVMESVVNQILTEFDGLEDMRGVVVMGATNRPDMIDPALLRAGRFDRLVYVGEPDEISRKRILQIHTRFMPIEGSAIDEIIESTKSGDERFFEEAFKNLSKKKDIMPNRQVSADELKEFLDAEKQQSAVSIPVYKRRKLIVDLLSKNALYLKDPKRDELIDKIASLSPGYVGSDLELLCREAAMFAMRDGKSSVDESYFKSALKKVHPMMNERLREQYENIRTYFKGGLPRQVQPVEYQ